MSIIEELDLELRDLSSEELARVDELLAQEQLDHNAYKSAKGIHENYLAFRDGRRPDFRMHFVFSDQIGTHPISHAYLADWLLLQPHPSEEGCQITIDGVKLFTKQLTEEIDGREVPVEIYYSTNPFPTTIAPQLPFLETTIIPVAEA